ncbi:uncharacterized protein LOC128229214 [Mya arenaria]|nr:uncharacterized protein LOC128229214 [Mya arenaria]
MSLVSVTLLVVLVTISAHVHDSLPDRECPGVPEKFAHIQEQYEKTIANVDDNSNALCPWETAYNTDYYRVPCRIQYAVCVTRHTCNFTFENPVRPGIINRLRAETKCTEVYRSFRVVYHYDDFFPWETTEDFAVACICEKR